MRIAVLVHPVLSAPGSAQTLAGLAPGDRAALGAALLLARQGGCEIVALAAGPAAGAAPLLSALGGGASRALRVWSNDINPDDHWAVSRLLATALRHASCDVVLAGDRSANWASGMMGPAVAHELKVPHVSGATGVAWLDGELRVEHRRGCATVTPPAVISFRPERALAAESLACGADATAGTLDVLDLTERNPTGRAKLIARPLQEATAGTHEALADPSALCARLKHLGLLR